MSRPGSEAENIVLIGMPGCGKTVIGAILAKRMKRPFFDTDKMVEKMAGRSIPQIFAAEGEAVFRDLERQATMLAAYGQGRVIASGGGTVLDAKNGCALAKNGRFYFIERALELLPLEGRPLSIDVHALYTARLPLYASLAAATIYNDTTIEEAAKKIIALHIE